MQIMKGIERGLIVKFKNPDGTLNGGTIIDIQKSSFGDIIACINTLDNKKVSMNIDKLIKIKHQIKGKQSQKFIDKIKEEIDTHNNGVKENPNVKQHQEELQLWINKYEDSMNKSSKKQQEIDTLVKENNDLIENLNKKNKKIESLEKELEDLKLKYSKDFKNEEHLQYTILGLQKAIIAGSEENHKKQLEALLEIILDLNGLG